LPLFQPSHLGIGFEQGDQIGRSFTYSNFRWYDLSSASILLVLSFKISVNPKTLPWNLIDMYVELKSHRRSSNRFRVNDS
jgi:hypothetical protein